jgi:integrase
MFLQERSISLSPTSISTDYAQVSKWLDRCPIHDLTQGRQAILWLLQQQPTRSARRVTMFLRCMYSWASAEDVGLLPRNPVVNFRMPKAPQSNHEITIISREEIPLVLNALRPRCSANADWASYAEFMLQTAMRTGEVRALTWDDIHGDRVLVHANFTLTHGHKASTKTNRRRWVPLNARAKQLLERRPQEDRYVYPWNRFTFQSFFRQRMQELHAAGTIKARYRPYDLRHVAISRWLEAGIPVTQAATWAGNTSEVIWRHYANTTTEYEMPVL